MNAKRFLTILLTLLLSAVMLTACGGSDDGKKPDASADATGKFRDKTNPNMVLCEFIPANGDEEGKWVQAIFKISDYGYWDEDGWKGTACMWTEIDVTGEQYAWMENAPEPLPTGFENIVLTEKAQKVVVDGMIYIVRDGKIYNVQGVEVR